MKVERVKEGWEGEGKMRGGLTQTRVHGKAIWKLVIL